MNTRFRAILSLAIGISIGGCRSSDALCPAILENAISLTVVDSVSGGVPAAVSTIVASNGAYTETVTNSSGNPMNNVYFIGFGRSGTFSIVARTPGYADWSTSGVQVTANSCGVPQPVNLMARLQR
jgi:hypothetical protein